MTCGLHNTGEAATCCASDCDMLAFARSPFPPPSPDVLPRTSSKMSSSVDLAEVSTDALVKEVQRRLECANKPEKRIILVGGCPSAPSRHGPQAAALAGV